MFKFLKNILSSNSEVEYLEKHLEQARKQINEMMGSKKDMMVCGHHVSCMQDDQCGMPEHKSCGYCLIIEELHDAEDRVESQYEQLEKLRILVKEYIKEHPEKGLEI